MVGRTVRVFLAAAFLAAGGGLMPRGYPDWQVNTGQFGAVEFDAGELAARLGSPYSFTRSGRVVYLDSFECGLGPWVRSTVGAASAVARSAIYPFRGRYSLELTNGAVINDYARVTKNLPLTGRGRIGVEGLVWFRATAADGRFVITADHQDSLGGWQFYIRVLATGVLQYGAAPSGTVQFADLGGSLGTTDPLFFLFKLVFDTSLGQYVSFRVNDAVYDLSGIPARTLAAATLGRVNWQLEADAVTANSRQIYLDDVAFTIDEP